MKKEEENRLKLEEEAVKQVGRVSYEHHYQQIHNFLENCVILDKTLLWLISYSGLYTGFETHIRKIKQTEVIA